MSSPTFPAMPLVRLWDWPMPPSPIASVKAVPPGMTCVPKGGPEDGRPLPIVATVRFLEDGPIKIGIVVALGPEAGGLWELAAATFEAEPDFTTNAIISLHDHIDDRARRVDAGQTVRALLERDGHRT